MSNNNKRDKGKNGALVDLFWALMDSMKFAVVLLILLTLISLIGVLLPQFLPSDFSGTLHDLYIAKYGTVLGNLMLFLGLDHVFTVWWYYLLLMLLCVHISVCSLRRLKLNINMVRRVKFFEDEEQFRIQSNNRSTKLSETVAQAKERMTSLLKKHGYGVHAKTDGDRELLYAKRGQWSQLGPFLTHISMVLVIVGAAFSYLLSFEHFQWMGKGEVIEVPNLNYLATPSYQAQLVSRRLASVFGLKPSPTPLMMTDRVVRNRDWRHLPDDLNLGTLMRVRLDKFEAQFTPEGKPKAYLSTVTVLDSDNGDKELFSHLIKVNDPLVYEGVYFYQSSFSPGGGNADWVELQIASTDSMGPGPQNVQVSPGGPAVALGSTGDSVKISQYTGNFRIGDQGKVSSMPGDDSNPAARVIISRDGQELVNQWVFKNFPNFSHQPGNAYSILMLDYQKSYLTGLTIRTHRSQFVIWIGFTLMVLGVLLSFYVNHRQYWVMVAPQESGSRVWIAGASYKWKHPFRQEFKEFCDEAAGKGDGDKT